MDRIERREKQKYLKKEEKKVIVRSINRSINRLHKQPK